MRNVTISLLVTALAVTGCTRDFASELGAEQLQDVRAESESVWLRHYSATTSSPQGVVIARGDWPPAIIAVGPEEVQVRADGVYLFVSSKVWNAQILFVPCPPCESIDLSNADGSKLREISPRVYDQSAR